MVTTTSESKINVQVRLPPDVFNQLRDEAERDMIPLTYVVRRCLVRHYGGDRVVSKSGTESTETVQKIQADATEGKA